MNPVIRYSWIFGMALVSFLDILTSYWAQLAGGYESNVFMHWLIELFGPGFALFFFGSILKIGLLIFGTAVAEFCLRFAATIPEKPARVFCEVAVYCALSILILYFVPFIVGNYLVSLG